MMPRYPVRAAQLHLRQHRPQGDPGRYFPSWPTNMIRAPTRIVSGEPRAASVSRQDCIAAAMASRTQTRAPSTVPTPIFGQRGLNLGPLAGDRVTAEANRSGTESPPDRPAGHDGPDRAGDGAHHLPRPGRASRSGFAAGTAFALRRKLTHQAGFAPWSGIAPGPGLGSPREFPTRSGFAPRCGFAVPGRLRRAAAPPPRRSGLPVSGGDPAWQLPHLRFRCPGFLPVETIGILGCGDHAQCSSAPMTPRLHPRIATHRRGPARQRARRGGVQHPARPEHRRPGLPAGEPVEGPRPWSAWPVAVRPWPRAPPPDARAPDVVVVGYLGHFDVHLARLLFRRKCRSCSTT